MAQIAEAILLEPDIIVKQQVSLPADSDREEVSTPSPANAPSAAPAQDQSTSPVEPTNRATQYGLSRESLEQEVGQVMGTLSSWWGGVKKQSATALSTIKADLDKTVTQAQADFEQLRTAKVEVVRKDAAEYAAEQQAEKERKAATPDGSSTEGASDSLLNRITSSTTLLQHNLQTSIQSTLAAAASNPALANATDLASHLRLSTAKENLQLSVKQAEKLAEEYLQRGEQLRKDAEKWMSEAVKVVPPGEGGSGGSGMGVDGVDWYSFVATGAPTAASKTTSDAAPSDGLQASRASTSSRALAGSRKDALLARLREDKDLVLIDPLSPSTPPEQRQRFERWVSERWPAQKESAIAQETSNAGRVRMAVVPEDMTDEQFWQRYLYIRDTILEEDEKRQQLLKAHEQSTANEDFTWDDEPEDSSSAVERDDPPTPKSKSPSTVPPVVTAQGTALPSTATSPRNSSEESYDVVSGSDQAPKVILVDGGAAGEKVKAAKSTRSEEETGSDSDWE